MVWQFVLKTGKKVIKIKSEIEIPKSAIKIEEDMKSILNDLIEMDVSSPLDDMFYKEYMRFLDLLKKFQDETINLSEYKCQCYAGCSFCCNHWVEDVNSFETILMGDYIKKNFPDKIEAIISTFKEDDQNLYFINQIMEEKISEIKESEELNHLDQTDLLLASYYQLKRPCALLDKDGKCSVYSVRPITCRIYFNFSKAEMCDPDKIHDPDIPTYLVDVQEETNLLLDKLHLKFNRFGSTGLRSTLAEYLSE